MAGDEIEDGGEGRERRRTINCFVVEGEEKEDGVVMGAERAMGCALGVRLLALLLACGGDGRPSACSNLTLNVAQGDCPRCLMRARWREWAA